MRVFIAVNLIEPVRNGLLDVMRRMKEASARGNFTRRENLHLTLAFLGEVPPARVNEIKRVMDCVREVPFTLSLSGFGRFTDIYWIGIDKNEALFRVQAALSAELKKAGFPVENREYKPHLTLCRETVLDEEFDMRAFGASIAPMRMTVDHISLMKSERINGRMVYSEIHSTPLK